jgi:3-phosphoshikimate 1-carboxyvinyltransferase
MKVEILPQPNSKQEQKESAPVITLPPDKSIFHRILIIGALTHSKITIPITAIEDIATDVYATILALESLGVEIEISRESIELQGIGIGNFKSPRHKINCGNSGTTARLLMGLLAGENVSATLTGDSSLSQRPMGRVAELLQRFGAEIQTLGNGTLPATINGKKLHSASVQTGTSSAQMKSAAILAALHVDGTSIISEKIRSRNHTELMLEAFGKGITSTLKETTVNNYSFTTPQEFTYHIPGDPSSAAYLIAAAMLLKKNITLKNMSVNQTRTKYFRRLRTSGITLERRRTKEEFKEKRADIDVFASDTDIEPFVYHEENTPTVIDEIPFLAVIAAFSRGDSIFFGAGELRKKESDRIEALVENINALGGDAGSEKDHFFIYGNSNFIPKGGIVKHHDDHRIAMAMAVLALRAKAPVTIPNAEVVSVSYPNFFHDLALIAGSDRIKIS